MAGIVYTTYEIAKEKALEKMEELEQDIFICSSRYPSGEEFILKTRYELMFCTKWLYIQEIPVDYKFKNRENAEREAMIKRKKTGKRFILIDTIRIKQNGYNNLSHYELCSI